MLVVKPIPALHDNYIWMIVHPPSRRAYVVDPGEAKPVFTTLAAQQLSLSGILITHHHWDHTGGIDELVAQYQVPVIASKASRVDAVTKPLKDGETIMLFEHPLQAITIPGHTLDHIAYYHPTMLFTGDTLFSAGCGRVFEGKPTQMWQSLQRLKRLPQQTPLYCGHEYTEANLHFAQRVEPENPDIAQYLNQVQKWRQQQLPSLPSNLAQEQLINPFLRTDQPAVKKAAERYANRLLEDEASVFAVLRTWKNNT